MAITLDGTNGITAANVYGRNLIINGSGRINQRGYVSGTNTSGANEYTLDRWRVVTSGQNLSFTGNDAGRVMTAPAGGAEQVIEGANIAGGTYVLNWTGTATVTVGGSAVSKGGTFTLTANTNATVRFTGGTFSEVQLEAGTVATPFEFRSIGQELALCQRYYEKSFPMNTAPANNLGTNESGSLYFTGPLDGGGFSPNMYWQVKYNVPKRGATTLTFYNPLAASAGTWRTYAGTVAAETSLTIDISHSTGFAGYVARASTTLAVGAWTADAEL